MSDEKIIVSQEELAPLFAAQNEFDELTKRLGILEFQNMMLGEQLEQTRLELKKLDAERVATMTALQEKYGVGTIDVQTGEFTPAQ